VFATSSGVRFIQLGIASSLRPRFDEINAPD
jgi:hypothetical protein